MEQVRRRTARLVLRNLRESDLDDVATCRANPVVLQYIGEPMTAAEIARHIAQRRDGWSRRDGETLNLAVELASDGVVLGETMLRNLNLAQQQAEIGIGLNLSRYRELKQLGMEAFLAMFDYGFREVGLHRIYGFGDVENVAMLRMISAISVRIEGTLRHNAFRNGRWRDEYVVAILADEWPEIRRRFEDMLAPPPGEQVEG
jgi:RimJ/RimL family protein N-acetyltransferase